MQQKITLRSLFGRFACNKHGSIAPIAGITFLAIMLSAGAAVDYSRISHTKNIVADALDAALLSAGKDLSSGAKSGTDLRDGFEDFFFSNVEIRSKQTDKFKIISFDSDSKTGTVSAKVEADLQMAFMGIIGKNRVQIQLDSEVRFKTDDIELAMMLDVTGSMSKNGKLTALQNAAKDAIDILMPVDGNLNGHTRIGLVPYSYSVNAGSYAPIVNQGKKGNTKLPYGYSLPHYVNKTNCIVERSEEAYTDASYTTAHLPTDVRAGCPDVAIRPLTNKPDDLKNDIDKFVADGYTAGHMGIAWTYYMLSQKWQELWPNESDPKDYAGNVQKIALLMTDGEFNTYYTDIDGKPFGKGVISDQAKASNKTAKGLCNDMKATKGGMPGIIIYSIAFSAPLDAQETLKACATPDTPEDQYYFEAKNEEQLRDAFREIALNIQKLRITR